ncbi:MAG: sugar kinase [Pseudomonadota bacterium]
MLTLNDQRVLAIGEAMIEMAVAGDDHYRRSFAGDTFNTAWHMSQIPDNTVEIGFVTMVGTDTVSDTFVQQVTADGMDASCIGRAADRTMGLYMIELDGVERSFHYWRHESAARLLANDEAWLTRVVSGAGLIHLSGITIVILGAAARECLWRVLSQARRNGARVSFDPNIRPRLWSSADESRTAVARFLEVTDIALPSFDDERNLWGDTDPNATLKRYKTVGVDEVVVKNGAESIVCGDGDTVFTVATHPVDGIKDTSGAGDAFNAGYLAARLAGQVPRDAVTAGQKVSAEVLRHLGARIAKGRVPAIAVSLLR